MSDTMDPMATDVDQQELAQQLLAQAREQGIDLVGPDGLLNRLTKNVLETALEAEMDEHLGYEKHAVAGRGSGNSRNGTRTKTVLTEIGPVEIDVPRDTGSTFDPQIVKKRQRRLTGVDEIVLSLSAKGLTTGEIAAHFDEVFGARVSKDTISRITEKVIGEMTEWQNRPLDRVYPVVFIDAIHVKVRDGQVTNRPVYVAIGVSVNGERDILGLWAGDGGEGAKFWLSVLTEIKNRGVEDVCLTVCDGLKGLPEAITTVWSLAVVQTCIVHLIRNTFRYAARQYWDEMSRTCARSTQHPQRRQRRNVSWSSRPNGAGSTRRSPGCGRTPGASSCRSWTTTWKSVGSFAAPMPSNPSTPATGARSGPGGISPRSRRR